MPAIFNPPILFKQSARKIVFVPARLNENNRTTRHQAREQRGSIPIPHQLPPALAVCLLTILERVIDQRNVSASARYSRANARSDICPAMVRVHAPSGLAVGCKGHIGEHLVELRLGHDVTDVAPEVVRKIAVVACRDNLPLRVPAETPCRKPLGCQLGLTVAWRHEDHQAVNLAALYSLQLVCNQLVMTRAYVSRVRVFSEREERVATLTGFRDLR